MRPAIGCDRKMDDRRLGARGREDAQARSLIGQFSQGLLTRHLIGRLVGEARSPGSDGMDVAFAGISFVRGSIRP